MPRRILEVTDKWQIASVRAAVITIVQEHLIDGNALLFNDKADEVTADRVLTGNKGLGYGQPEPRVTYVKSAKPPEGIKTYKIVVDD